jgi:hypothetical protein
MPKPKKPSPKKPAAPDTAAAAYKEVQSEIDAMSGDDLAVINVDIPQAVSTVLGVLPKIAPLREAIVVNLPSHPIKSFDKLGTYALAAWYTHLLTLPPASPSSPLKPLVEEAGPLREDLLSDAEALARRKLIDASVVSEIRSGQGNIDMANDLVALSALFSNNWDEVQGKTAATEAEVERAGKLGPLILAALGMREQGAVVTPAEAAAKKARAFTLLVRAYDETRRAVTYLRWRERDADELAPSLYKGRGRRGGAAEEAAGEGGETATRDTIAGAPSPEGAPPAG